MLNKQSKILLMIFILALVLRFTGITNSFPFIFHPDEPTIIRSALALRFFKNPGHFDWPHLYIYLNYFIYMIFAKFRDLLSMIGLKEFVYFSLPIVWNDKLIFYLITRLITAIFGALTVIPIYLIGKNLFNKRAGLLAAAALALAPLHIWYSHYALPDVPMLFFACIALYFCSKILFIKDSANYLLAGFFIGLSASTKYNGLLMVIPLITAHLFRILSEKDERIIRGEEIQKLIYAAVASIFAFLLGTPYAALDFNTFIRTDGPKGALWQFVNVGSVGFIDRLKNFVNILFIQFNEDIGFSFEILFLVAMLFLIFKFIKTKKLFEYKDLLFLVFSSIVIIFYMAGAEKIRSHYFFVVYPLIILSGAGILEYFLERLKIKYPTIIILFIFLAPLYFALRTTFIFYQEDTRVQFFNWLTSNYQKNTIIYYDGGDLTPLFENINYKSQKAVTTDSLQLNSLFVVADGSKDNLKLIQSFDNNLRKGPYINVYEIVR